MDCRAGQPAPATIAHAYAASGLADILADHPTLADLGYVGVDGSTPSRTSEITGRAG